MVKRVSTLVAAAVVCVSAGCASTRPTPVMTTSAELVTPEAPRVGKAQRSSQAEGAKDERPTERRPGGGFSGWK